MKMFGRIALLTGVAASSDSCDILDGQNNHGSNLKMVRLGRKATAQQCCDKCSETAGCVGFTLIKADGRCYLKDGVEQAAADSAVVSGSMQPVPPVPAPVPQPTPAPVPSPTPAQCTMTLVDKKNSGGSNIKMVKLQTVDECCDACMTTDACVGFTLVKKRKECWLKSGLDDFVRDDAGVVSGFAGPAPPPAPTPPPPTPSPYPKGCGRDDATDPKYTEQKPTIRWREINLDLDPQLRWHDIVAEFQPKLLDVVTTFKDIAGVVSKELFALLEALEKQDAEVLLDAMPYPYGDEVRGIAKAGNLTSLDALICNLIYEISGACTAIIGQTDDGHVFQAHNLDTAANWNFSTGQWELAEKLRQITTNVKFMKNGVNIYNATTYAGYAGIFEGMKAGAFSITVNTRFDSSLYKSLIAWIVGTDRSGQFGTFNVRDALEKDATFDEAVHRLDTTKLMGPGYFSIAGVKPGEGAIMSRNANTSLRFWSLKDELRKGKSYMVQTNYKHWNPDPIFDKRRVPCQKCMDGIISNTSGNFGFEDLFAVVSAKPTRNKMTCHSVLFNPLEGKMESYQQYCFEKGCRLVSEMVV